MFGKRHNNNLWSLCLSDSAVEKTPGFLGKFVHSFIHAVAMCERLVCVDQLPGPEE